MLIARRLILPLIGCAVLISLITVGIHLVSERAIVQEVRKLLAGLASTTAEGLMLMPEFQEHFREIDGSLDPTDTSDPRHEAFHRIVQFLDQVQDRHSSLADDPTALSPRIRFVYTLRWVPPNSVNRPAFFTEEGEISTGLSGWQFVVDPNWFDEDENGDGEISDDEVGVHPGLHYPEGADLPDMRSALIQPSADRNFNTDSWGTVLSGYAPLRLETGEVVGILGVDLEQVQFRRTVLGIRAIAGGAWLIIVSLLLAAFHLLSHRYRHWDEIAHRDQLLREKNASLSTANREFSRQLELAHRVQQRLLPAEFPKSKHLDFGAIYMACEAVGGDIYDVFRIDDNNIGVYIADVSGHGISAALIGATLKMSIDAMQADGLKSSLLHPKEVVERVHTMLTDHLEADRFITMQYATLSVSKRTLTLCNAGHTWPLWWHNRSEMVETLAPPSGLPINYLDQCDLSEVTYSLERGDKFLLYTDGLTEHLDPSGDEMFGVERLAKAMEASGHEAAKNLVMEIRTSADQFSEGNPCGDDVAMVVIEVLSEVANSD